MKGAAALSQETIQIIAVLAFFAICAFLFKDAIVADHTQPCKPANIQKDVK